MDVMDGEEIGIGRIRLVSDISDVSDSLSFSPFSFRSLLEWVEVVAEGVGEGRM